MFILFPQNINIYINYKSGKTCSLIDYNGIGNRIKHRRMEKGLTQSQLAELASCSNNHISTVELGKSRPSLELIVAISEALDTTPDFLLLGLTHSNDVPQELVDTLKLLSPRMLKYSKLWFEFLLLHKKELD